MVVNRARHFKLTFLTGGCIVLFLFGYLLNISVSYQLTYLNTQSQLLTGFTERAITRVSTNPARYLGENAYTIGDKKMQLLTSYEKLSEVLEDVPNKKALKFGEINLFVTQLRGFFSVSDYLLIYALNNKDRDYYSYVQITPEMNDDSLNFHLRQQIQPAIFISVILMSVLFVYQFLQMNKVTKLVNELAGWADRVSANGKFEPPPTLNNTSMSYLAHTMSSSLNTFSNILEKECSFARFTSHELRTHVATLSANIAILEMISKDLTNDEKKVLKRMLTAIDDMKYQTEALLWLSKETDNENEVSPCDLRLMVDKALEENEHLIEKTPVKALCTGKGQTFLSHPVLLQIAISNLVRNAFQNTLEGVVHVGITNTGFSIVNSSINDLDERRNRSGFGIGLILVERIVEKLNLNYKVHDLESGRVVEVTFNAQIT
jgi:signal transduction histidine kinase